MWGAEVRGAHLGRRWCQLIAPLPGPGRWHWVSTQKITDHVETGKERDLLTPAWRSSPARAWGRTGRIAGERVRGRMLRPALPRQTGGFRPPEPSLFWAEVSAGSTSQLLQLQPLPAWVATGTTWESQHQHQLQPASWPMPSCYCVEQFPGSFNTNFTISIATWHGKDYEIKITTKTPLVTMFSGGSGLKDKKGK